MSLANPTIPQSWCPAPFTTGERDLIRERVRTIGQGMSNIGHVLKLAEEANRQGKYFIRASHGYRLHSLAQGPLGVALFYDELHRTFPDDGWNQVAQGYLSLLQGGFNVEGRDALGLFSGMAGLVFMTHHFSHGGTRYMKMGGQALEKMLVGMHRLFNSNETLHPDLYGLCSGAVGIGVTLLTLAEALVIRGVNPDVGYVQKLSLRRLLRHLSWISHRDVAQEVEQFEHWYLSSEMYETQMKLRAEGSAYHGYGMWQGLAGLISFLSLAQLSPVNVQESKTAEALEYICKHVRQGMRRGTVGWYWPQENLGSEYHRPGPSTAFSWCNGTAGIARALWLAGRALHDEMLCTLALECIAELGRCFRHNPHLLGPSLCHGLAGLTLVCAHFAHDTADPTLHEDVHAMTDRLLELFEPDRPFGYRVCEPEYIRYDSPWFMEGASGIALVLLALVDTVPPSWDRALLLA